MSALPLPVGRCKTTLNKVLWGRSQCSQHRQEHGGVHTNRENPRARHRRFRKSILNRAGFVPLGTNASYDVMICSIAKCTTDEEGFNALKRACNRSVSVSPVHTTSNEGQ